MINVKKLKEKYPNQAASIDVTITDVRKGSYCVGGALCLELYEVGRYSATTFPSSKYLRDALNIANPNLSIKDGRYYADLIIDLNDAGEFKHAWQILERALTYDSKKIPKE